MKATLCWSGDDPIVKWMLYAVAVRALAATLTLVLGAGVAVAQPRVPLPSAPLAVTGRVLQVESRWDAATTTIVTYVDIAVDRYIRGPGTAERLVLKQLGGRVGSIGLYIPDQARFAVGERALLLLAVNPRDGSLHTAGLGRGKLPADADAIAQVESAPLAADPAPYVAVPPERGDVLYAPAFAFLPTDGGYPARWHEVDDDGTVFVDHPSALPATWSGSTANLTAAINLWRGSGMELDLRQGNGNVPAGVCPAAFSGNGRIAVAYNDPGCGVADEADNWVIGGGYYTTGDLRTVNGTTFQKFIQGFVVLNNAGPQSGSAGCFQDAITHGLGHALGLGHSDSGGAMMNPLPSGSCASGARGLSGDDRRRDHRHLPRHRQRSQPAGGADGAHGLGGAVDGEPVVDALGRGRAGATLPGRRRQPQLGCLQPGHVRPQLRRHQHDLRQRPRRHLLRPRARAERDRHQRSVARGAGVGRFVRRARRARCR